MKRELQLSTELASLSAAQQEAGVPPIRQLTIHLGHSSNEPNKFTEKITHFLNADSRELALLG